MANLREYRRDQARISKTLLERKDIRNVNDFQTEYKKYMKGAQEDPNFKQGVLTAIKNKQGDKFSTRVKKKRIPQARQDYVFAGTQKGSKAIQRARFDRKLNRYRNERGQFVKKV